jgi:glycosyltransferase involved in cell wall biosynthesis
VDLSLPLKNLKVIPASIPEEWTHIKITSKREPLIVWLGKIRRYKCPHHVVLAMKQVCQEYPEAKLIIAGKREDVKYERELRYLAQKKGISENVEIMTNLTEREKRDLLLRAKVLVLPSPIEGFGIVVLEANACGTPVIASSGVPKDAVQHLNNGLRYPFNDISALTNSILQVLKDDELFKQLSNNSLTFVRQFAWSKVSAQFENLVKLVAEQRK